MSEGARQQFELLRNAKREYAALIIQTAWRGWNERKKWPSMKDCMLSKLHSPRMSTTHFNGQSMTIAKNSDQLDPYIHHHSHHHLNNTHNGPPSLGHHPTASLGALTKPRPQPISGSPPLDKCDQRIVAKTCSLFGLDLVLIGSYSLMKSYRVYVDLIILLL